MNWLSSYAPGIRFCPKDGELFCYYLYRKVQGVSFSPLELSLVQEYDLYGEEDPWTIWQKFGGDSSKLMDDLFFFTKLKKKRDGAKRCGRTVGHKGTWSGEGGDSFEFDEVKGMKKRFHYENPAVAEEDGRWIMHEYSLHDQSANWVLCMLRKNVKGVEKKNKRGKRKPDDSVNAKPSKKQKPDSEPVVTMPSNMCGNATNICTLQLCSDNLASTALLEQQVLEQQIVNEAYVQSPFHQQNSALALKLGSTTSKKEEIGMEATALDTWFDGPICSDTCTLELFPNNSCGYSSVHMSETALLEQQAGEQQIVQKNSALALQLDGSSSKNEEIRMRNLEVMSMHSVNQSRALSQVEQGHQLDFERRNEQSFASKMAGSDYIPSFGPLPPSSCCFYSGVEQQEKEVADNDNWHLLDDDFVSVDDLLD